jgi:diguanylate cyclase (GGDEF)-like protein
VHRPKGPAGTRLGARRLLPDMTSSLHRLADCFGAHTAQNRDAHERDRAWQRSAIAAAFALLLGAGHLLAPGAQPEHVVGLIGLCALYAGLGLLYLKGVLARGRSPVAMQYLFIVLDPALTIVVVVGAPQWAAAFYVVVMVQIVRVGIRYGMGTLWLSWAGAAVAAALLMPLSDFWMHETQLLRSFMVTMLVIPVLFNPLIRRLHDVTNELRTAAGSDPLTGLGNRRMLAEHIRLAKERSQRDGTMLAVILLDLDNFKQVNDTLGHARGDALLAAVSAAIRGGIRAGDFLARVGGDEFVLLVEGLSMLAGQQQAQEIAQKLVGVIEGAARGVAPAAGVSASVGVQCWAYALDPQRSSQDLLDGADRAMYLAKQAGKARVNLAAA